ncbi:DNA polymerase III subunit gamma/tau [Sulfurimonas sp. HSL3-7]|uniref:DNA polymerase III subunit gamma/tau n=1 Tax=Sulfonitrofixus jiaomeiensis TaxID=3131938 RepID=UPI0031F85C60
MKESSEVLARKYRPESFSELIGQETISQTLSLALDSNRLSHAYLFSGLRGSGKTSTARIFAKALICEQGPTSNPCGICEHCMMAKEGRHMDIIEMDAASSRKIDDIRDLIEHTKYKPAAGQYKIFIIDEVHMLTKEAFNALLKTLEEPPPYVKFILATTDPLKLPATILSRTQHFRFKRISILNVVHHLQHILQLENITYEDAALEILARSGSGSLRDTLTLLDQAIIYSKNHVDIQTVTDMLGLVDPQSIEAIFSAIFNNDREALLAHIQELEEYEAEMVVDELIAFLKERLYAQDGRYSILLLERFFRILSDAKSLFSINADGGFVLSMIFFKMLEAMKVKEIDQMIESLEAQIGSGAPMPRPQQTPPVQAATTAEKAEPAAEVPATPEEPVMPAEKAVEPPVASDAKERALFKQLIQKIEDRSIDLGRCFKEQISFVSYRDDLLIWESCADEECKKQLKHGYSVIKQFVREIFGFETQIKAQKCSKAAPSTPPEPTPTPEPQAEGPQTTAAPQTPPQQQMQQPVPDTMQNAPQSSSMTEESEVGTGSCVAGCSDSDQSTKEFDGQAILDEPMIQKATELFEATKITIQNKV